MAHDDQDVDYQLRLINSQLAKLNRKVDIARDQLYRMEGKLDQLLSRPLAVDLTRESDMVLNATAEVLEAKERIPTLGNIDFTDEDVIVRGATTVVQEAIGRVP